MQRATATPDLTPEEEAAVREWFVDRVPDSSGRPIPSTCRPDGWASCAIS